MSEQFEAIEAEARQLYGGPGEDHTWQDGVEWTLRRVRGAYSSGSICGVISHAGPFADPVACAYPPNDPDKPMHWHSWASLPTFVLSDGVRGISGRIIDEAMTKAERMVRRYKSKAGIPNDDLPIAVLLALAALPSDPATTEPKEPE